MERFILKPIENLKWIVSDTKNNVSITFREGLYNETQKVEFPDAMPNEMATEMPTIMREIADWMCEEHREVAMCSPAERCTVLWTLANEKYWLALAAAMNSLLVDFDETNAAVFLYGEVEDYIQLEDNMLNEAEARNLLGSLSMLSDREAMEVVRIVYVFWNYKSQMSISDWARDLLWWPAWCPKELTDIKEEDI